MPKTQDHKAKGSDDERDDQVVPGADDDQATDADSNDSDSSDDDDDEDDEADDKPAAKVAEVVELSDGVEDSLRKIVTDTMSDYLSKQKLDDDKPATKRVGSGRASIVDGEWDKLPKEVRLLKALSAYRNHDAETLRSYHDYALASNQKAGYLNATTNADGGFLVPDADFIIEVNKLVDQYGVARRDAQNYQTNSDSVKIVTDTSGVAMYEVTSEAGEKRGTKMAFKQITAALREFAAIAPVTRILDEDAAVNVFNLITQGFARETARWEDTLVFTDASTGLTENTSTKAQTVGANLAAFDLDDFSKAIAKVHPAARLGAKFYVSTVLESYLRELKDSNGRYHLTPDPSGQTAGTLWGYPVETVAVLPTADAANQTYAIFGNLQNVTLIRKRGILIDELKEATVKDADGNTLNLALQNMTAIRADIRMNAVVRVPEAFTLIGTGSVS